MGMGLISHPSTQPMASRNAVLRRAVALGLIQGPTELLPVSSSAHLTVVPWLAGWDWERLDPEMRKSFEVALHAGGAAALLIGQRKVIASELRVFDRRRAAVIALSFLPPAIAGYTLEREIEGRLGGPKATAVALLAGAAAMVLADRRPQVRDRGVATAGDGLALGFAQASALVPGVSRNGATLAAARWRGFTREQANMLSRTVALPVIVGAAILKLERLRRRGVPPETRRALAAGVGASFASTLASQELIKQVERDRALWPYAAYRTALAATVLARLRKRRRRPLGSNGHPGDDREPEIAKVIA
jgi:undecaprenyl-diphosphatase